MYSLHSPPPTPLPLLPPFTLLCFEFLPSQNTRKQKKRPGQKREGLLCSGTSPPSPPPQREHKSQYTFKKSINKICTGNVWLLFYTFSNCVKQGHTFNIRSWHRGADNTQKKRKESRDLPERESAVAAWILELSGSSTLSV